MRVAIYARVSTDDKGQDPENQLRELRAWCSASGHTIVQEYIDRQSGRRGADKRQQFAALLEATARRKFDCILFWALDRFSREGMALTIGHLQRLTSYGVSFHSYTEPHLSTDNELVGNILLALLSSLAKLWALRQIEYAGKNLHSRRLRTGPDHRRVSRRYGRPHLVPGWKYRARVIEPEAPIPARKFSRPPMCSLVAKRACCLFVDVKNVSKFMRVFATEPANRSNPEVLQIFFCQINTASGPFGKRTHNTGLNTIFAQSAGTNAPFSMT
jgi:predicted site-specific integrase-resolvase